MKILAVEFSSAERSIALLEKTGGATPEVLGSASERGGRTARAFALIEKVLAPTGTSRDEIECIAIGLGPGSYAGIRAAIALAQGWSLAREIKTLGVSSAEALAFQAHAQGRRGRVHIVIDAQRQEFYSATYEITDASYRATEPLRLVAGAEVKKLFAENEIVLGPEISGIDSTAENLFPNATALGKIACAKTDFIAPEKLEPIYLRHTSFVKAPKPRPISD